MRKFLIALFCLFSLTVTASAAGVVSQLESNTRIDTDGTCEVSLTMQLRIDSPHDENYDHFGDTILVEFELIK